MEMITVFFMLLTLSMLPHSGSKLVIRGQNLDSGQKVEVNYTAENAKEFQQVSQIFDPLKVLITINLLFCKLKYENETSTNSI